MRAKFKRCNCTLVVIQKCLTKQNNLMKNANLKCMTIHFDEYTKERELIDSVIENEIVDIIEIKDEKIEIKSN